MKLFVWNQPYGVDYGSSVLYVIAPDLESAKERAHGAAISEFGYEPTRTMAITGLAAPDRVVDLSQPYAEVYQWSE